VQDSGKTFAAAVGMAVFCHNLIKLRPKPASVWRVQRQTGRNWGWRRTFALPVCRN